ncbi:MAG: HEAT repeat domain-containing protein [Candidatus Syntrophosphaera sp.]|nr:HEAT repeat domain-containing protein [Candidatus Syntrophosphaera sp.]
MRYFLVLLMLAPLSGLLCAENFELLSPAETGQLVEMLEYAGLDSTSLRFEKDWSLSTKFKLDWQLRQLQDPWQALDDLAELRELCAIADEDPNSLPRLLTRLGGIAFNLDPERYGDIYESSHLLYSQSFGLQVRRPRDIFAWLEQGLDELQADFSPVVSALGRENADLLFSFWVWQFIESEDADKYGEYFKEQGLPDPDSLETKEIYKLMADISLEGLLRCGTRFFALADVLVREAASLDLSHKKTLTRKTRYGLMAIGTRGDDVYSAETLGPEPLCLLLDPDGNDVYDLDLNTSFGHNFYLLVDLAGSDVYRNSTPGGMFSSAFGFGYSCDLGGDDFYQTGDFAFSAFAGMNLHIDREGDDNYRGGLFSQGAAMFGVSLLLDQAGNDSYQASVSGQGFASTHGVGALLDQGGADTYALGGKYFHEPLMPLDYITLGQGMGLGLRPDLAGGLGLLYDKGGNDRYLGGVYAQGSGYWYATGALLDEAGNDVYNTVYYPQGSGIHLACGFLFDGGGDDAYYSRHGPGQGAGHDWALGMLIDAGGNDAYSIQGGNGLGLTNSVGIFVDKSGDDRYERNEGQNFGNANFSRSTGGIGLFLDAGGKDAYPDSLHSNDNTWQKGTYGIGWDIELNIISKTAIEDLAETAALPDSTDSIADIFAAASEWEVGSAVQRVRTARDILISRAEEAIPYVLEKKIGTDSGLEYRALEILAKSSDAFVRQLFDLIEGADSLAAKNALSLISGVGDSLLVDYVERLLQAKKYETACLSVLAGVHSERGVAILREYIHHPSERFRYITARSLLQIKHPQARETLLLMEEDRSFLVQALLRNLPAETLP